MRRESKLVVLGAGGVGKSSLVLQHLQGRFSPSYKPTVEDCYNQTLQLPNGLFQALEILDTAGSHNFPAMRELSIKCGRGFILVFAVNSEQSFYEAQNLWSLIKEIKDSENVPVIVVGNKIDLSAEREVTWQMGKNFVTSNMPNGSYIETSAKYNLYVNDVFNELLILTFGAPSPRKVSRPARLSLSLSEISLSSFRRKSSSTNSAASSFNTASIHSSTENTSIFGLSRTRSSYSGSKNTFHSAPERNILYNVSHESDFRKTKPRRSSGDYVVRATLSYQCRQKLRCGASRSQRVEKCVLL